MERNVSVQKFFISFSKTEVRNEGCIQLYKWIIGKSIEQKKMKLVKERGVPGFADVFNPQSRFVHRARMRLDPQSLLYLPLPEEQPTTI